MANPKNSNLLVGNPNGFYNGKNARPSYENIIEKHESFEKNYPRTTTTSGATKLGNYAVRSEYNIGSAGQKPGGSIIYQQITLANERSKVGPRDSGGQKLINGLQFNASLVGKIASPLTLNGAGVGPKNGIPTGSNGLKFDASKQNGHSYYAAQQHGP